MKAAGHDLKSLMAFFDCIFLFFYFFYFEIFIFEKYVSGRVAGLHVPLSCIIDFKGHRLLAMSIVPIDKDSIVYGSK